MSNQRGFIQIPILMVIFVAVAVLGGTGYVAYEVGQKSSQNTSQQKQVGEKTETQVATTEEIHVAEKTLEKKPGVETEEVDVVKPTCSVSVSPATIAQGGTATLSWETTGSEFNSVGISSIEVVSKKISGGIQGDHKSNGSVVVAPVVSTKYSINFYPAPNCSTILTVIPTLSAETTSSPQTSVEPENFERPIGAPSVEQLRGLMWLCGYNAELEKICSASKFVESYFTKASFRSLTDDLIVYAQQKLAEQQSQNEATRQAYLEYLQYTSYTPPAIPPRIETYSIPVYSGGLKLETPQYETNRRWEIQWTGGGGGFITDGTSGGTTHFQCTEGKCFSL